MINHIFITVADVAQWRGCSLYVREDVSKQIIFLFIFIWLFYLFLLTHTFITKKLPKGSAFSSDARFCFRKKIIRKIVLRSISNLRSLISLLYRATQYWSVDWQIVLTGIEWTSNLYLYLELITSSFISALKISFNQDRTCALWWQWPFKSNAVHRLDV